MKLHFFYFFAIALFFTACQKEEFRFASDISSLDSFLMGNEELTNEMEDDKQIFSKHRGRAKCFEVVFPITLTMPDASTITLNEQEDWSAVKTWYKENPDVKEKPSLNFPIEVIFKDESTATINNQEELKAVRKECFEDKNCRKGKKFRECFEFVFPISFTMPDGTVISVEEQEDWFNIREWYETNPDVEEEPSLNFPVEVTLEDGSKQTVNDQEELGELAKSCFGDKGYDKCFELVFPISLTMPDDSVIILESKEDKSEVRAWYEANPNAEEKPDINYPIDLQFEDGTIQTINSNEDWDEVKEICD